MQKSYNKHGTHSKQILDRYFGNVCELDIIFNFHRAYAILYEVFMGGYICETSKVSDSES